MGEIPDDRRVAFGSATVGADARQLEAVLEPVEAVRRGDVVDPRVEAAVGELDHTVAARAHEVVVVLPAAHAVARLARTMGEHVHHLVCSSCHRVVELPDCRLDPWLDDVAAAHGFDRLEHRLELTGVCADCR